jgi:hypothetical protein
MKSATTFIAVFGLVSISLQAQMISDVNILNNGTTAAAAASNTNYGGFSPGNADDLTSAQFFFADYERDNGADSTNVNTQYLTFSGLSAPTGIGSLRFYDPNQYEIGRVATQVTIYYATGSTASGDFTLSDYTALNGGTPYVLSTGINGRYDLRYPDRPGNPRQHNRDPSRFWTGACPGRRLDEHDDARWRRL